MQKLLKFIGQVLLSLGASTKPFYSLTEAACTWPGGVVIRALVLRLKKIAGSNLDRSAFR